MKQLLEGGGGGLKQVDEGGEGGKGDGHEEHDEDNAAAGDALEHVGKEDEHQARAALVQLLSGHRHGGDDDQSGQNGGAGVEQSYHLGVGRHVGIVAQIGAVDQGAVACNGKGEEGLAQGEDPHHGVQQTLGLQHEDVLISRRRAGEGDQIDSQSHEQKEEQGSHDLVGFFNAFAHAERHDNDGHSHAGHLPARVSGGSGAKLGAEGVQTVQSGQRAGDGSGGVLEDPPGHHGIADGQSQRTQYRDQTQQLARLFGAEAQLGGCAEGVDGAGAGSTAKGHLSNHAGRADDDHEDQIGDQEGGPAVLGDPGREQPDVAHAHRRTNAGQNEAPFGAPGISFGTVCHMSHSFV